MKLKKVYFCVLMILSIFVFSSCDKENVVKSDFQKFKEVFDEHNPDGFKAKESWFVYNYSEVITYQDKSIYSSTYEHIYGYGYFTKLFSGNISKYHSSKRKLENLSWYDYPSMWHTNEDYYFDNGKFYSYTENMFETKLTSQSCGSSDLGVKSILHSFISGGMIYKPYSYFEHGFFNYYLYETVLVTDKYVLITDNKCLGATGTDLPHNRQFQDYYYYDEDYQIYKMISISNLEAYEGRNIMTYESFEFTDSKEIIVPDEYDVEYVYENSSSII